MRFTGVSVGNPHCVIFRPKERAWTERELYGLGMERSFGWLVLRGEYALQPGRAFNLRDPHSLAFVELDQHRAALGLDFDAPLGLFINAQYLVDELNGEDDQVVPMPVAAAATSCKYIYISLKLFSLLLPLCFSGQVESDVKALMLLTEHTDLRNL